MPIWRAFFAAALWLGAACCAAAAAAALPDAQMRALAEIDLRVATIAYRLATSGSVYCPRTLAHLPGWVVGDAAQYAPGARTAASRLFGLGEGETIVGVVPGGAAAAAGVRPGDNIAAINGVALPDGAAAPGAPASYKPLGATLDALDAAFAAGSARLELRRGSQPVAIVLTGAAGCRSTFQIETSDGFHASANGKIVSITSAMVAFARSDDELAFVLAHELAHNILGHRVRLEEAGVSFGLLRGFGRNPERIRRTETEADYLGLYLVAQAGYDPDAALSFWTRFARSHGDGLIRDNTHMKDRDRLAFIERGVAEIRRKQAAGEPLRPDFASLP